MRIKTHLGSLAILTLLSTPAIAQDCKPLQLIESIKMTTLPNDGRRTVPVSVEGTMVNLLLDTGGFVTGLTAEAAEKAKLHIQKSSPIRLYTLNGEYTTQTAAVDEMMIGRMRFTRTRAVVYPWEKRPYEGLLAANMLFNYDVELDFANNTMRYFLTDHCEGKVIYWKPAAVGVVPITLPDKAYVQVVVSLNDQRFDALIDTGATDTVMTSLVAKTFFGVDAPGPGDQLIEGTDPKDPTYIHTFAKLSFGDITVLNPRVVIYPDHFRDKDRTQQTESRAKRESDDVKRTPLLIGMNILQKLHVYMAFGEKKFYVTPASAPVAAPAQ